MFLPFKIENNNIFEFNYENSKILRVLIIACNVAKYNQILLLESKIL